MIEAFDLSFNLIAYLEPILTAGLECSQNFRFYAPHSPTSTNYHDLVKNLSKVSGKIFAKTLERIMHCFGTHS